MAELAAALGAAGLQREDADPVGGRCVAAVADAGNC